MVLRIYSKRLSTTANTDEQEVFSKHWPVPVTLRAMKIETSDTIGGDLTVRGTIDGETFLYDSDPVVLEKADWIPLATGPAQPNGKVYIEVDNSHATNTPDIKVTIIVDVGVAPPDNLPWIHGVYATSSAATLFTKTFSKNAALYWIYVEATAGKFYLTVAGNRIFGDDEGFVDEPLTPAQGLAYPQGIPANVEFAGVTESSATVSAIVAVNKPR
jgi:hypothetical protein